jgi:UDP-N-acetylglucosamine--N-acetylmuramyl-(pentapeptide) pyrophosphoryl-undecaprenol N-acetylglucosamine transferase
MNSQQPIRIAIACGGTGGHLFPGLAVAEQLVARNCAVTLLVSPKEVDQTAVKQARGMKVVTLPAVGLSQGKRIAFVRGFIHSYRAARNYFREFAPDGALAMGGFTSAPPILAAKRSAARVFLHESNTIPGRANRWLSRVVHQAFVGFPQTAARLHCRNVTVTGTPVRPQFQSSDAAACRRALGLDPENPVLVVTGGSQGASGLNDLIVRTLALFRGRNPHWQLVLLTGSQDAEKVREAVAASGLKSVVHAFFPEMHLVLGAATVAVSRAGASSLAELAALRLPAVLIPFPAATDNHQFHNARAFEATGAARLLEQKGATPELLAGAVAELSRPGPQREAAQSALAQWHAPQAAEQIANVMLETIAAERKRRATVHAHGCGSCGCGHEDHAKTRVHAA